MIIIQYIVNNWGQSKINYWLNALMWTTQPTWLRYQ